MAGEDEVPVAALLLGLLLLLVFEDSAASFSRLRLVPRVELSFIPIVVALIRI